MGCAPLFGPLDLGGAERVDQEYSRHWSYTRLVPLGGVDRRHRLLDSAAFGRLDRHWHHYQAGGSCPVEPSAGAVSADGQAVDSIVAPLQRNGHSVHGHARPEHGPVADQRTTSRRPGRAATTRRWRCCAGVSTTRPAADTHQFSRSPRHSDVDTRVHLLEAGADDVVAQPVDERELEALSRRSCCAPRQPVSPSEDASAAPPRPAQTAPGRVIVFAAAKGGSGTTTLAVNTALVLAENAPASVSIADIDMAHGQISTHLDIYARVSTAQMAGEDRAAQSPTPSTNLASSTRAA